MISRFFKKKPKPKPEPVRKAAPKKPAAKSSAAKKTKPLPTKSAKTKTPDPKPVVATVSAAETYSFSLPSFKSGKIITAEGWKRMMMRKSCKK